MSRTRTPVAFRTAWDNHEVGIRPDPDQSHHLLVYTAVPGSESYEKLELLSVVGTQTLEVPSSDRE